MKTFRLIRSGPSSASYNMALDEKIFTRYIDERIPVFRVYRWKKPSFTYGVSQNPSDDIDLAACSSDGIEAVKRITGGGVLLHNDEITYSFVCAKQDVGEPEGAFISYREICAFLTQFYKSLGLKPSFAYSIPDFKQRSVPNRLCGASYEKYDIIINGRKIGGNAQKRARQVIFQHGVIPCSIDWDLQRRYLKTFSGDMQFGATSLSEELAEAPDKDMLEDKLIDAFASVFGVSFVEEKEALYETVMAQ